MSGLRDRLEARAIALGILLDIADACDELGCPRLGALMRARAGLLVMAAAADLTTAPLRTAIGHLADG